MVQLWARLLHAAPGSRLLLKWKTLRDEDMRRHLAGQFAGLGIGAERLELRGESSHQATLEQYADVDVALDPFPFSGGLTSCDALWMGVPVVTLPGDASQSRQTAGLLGAIGIADWIARSPDEYVSIALRLLSAPEALRRTRHTGATPRRSRMGWRMPSAPCGAGGAASAAARRPRRRDGIFVNVVHARRRVDRARRR